MDSWPPAGYGSGPVGLLRPNLPEASRGVVPEDIGGDFEFGWSDIKWVL